MDEETRAAILSGVEKKGYAKKLGMELAEVSEGHAVLEMTTGPDDTNLFGTVHGGAVFSLMDEAFQASCNSHGTVAVALSVNIVYHNPTRPGARLRAESREIHRSNKTATYHITVTDDTDTLVATCQALAYRKKERVAFPVN